MVEDIFVGRKWSQSWRPQFNPFNVKSRTTSPVKSSISTQHNGLGFLAGLRVWSAASGLHSKLCECSKNLRFGSLDLGTFGKKEGEEVETLTRRKIDLCTVHETRWCGGISKSQNRMLTGKDSRYKFFWTGNKGKGWCRRSTGRMMGGERIWHGLHLRPNNPLESNNRQGHLYHHISLCPPVLPHRCRKKDKVSRVVRQLQEKFYAINKTLCIVFVDLEMVLEHVPRKVTWWAFRKLSIEECLVQHMQSMCENSRCRVHAVCNLS